MPIGSPQDDVQHVLEMRCNNDFLYNLSQSHKH
jgi:hypothetical protein